MENNLDLLTKKLYAEGVEKARVEAEALLSGARAQAEKLVADAMQEAAEIRKRAEQDAAALAKKSETELEASRAGGRWNGSAGDGGQEIRAGHGAGNCQEVGCVFRGA